MALSELMTAIEGHSFSAEVNFAAGRKTFAKELRRHELFVKLVEQIREAQGQSDVLRRIKDLSGRIVDARYENVADAALSAYLTALSETASPEVVNDAAETAAKARNCWWTVGISRELMVRAVATGAAQGAQTYVEASTILAGVDWHEAIRERLHEWFAERNAAIHSDASGSIAELLRRAQEKQTPVKVVGMPLPESDERERRLQWKPRRRHARGTAVQRGRTKQAAGAF